MESFVIGLIMVFAFFTIQAIVINLLILSNDRIGILDFDNF